MSTFSLAPLFQGVLVSMQQGPTVITTASVPQNQSLKPQIPQGNMIVVNQPF